MMGYFIFLFPSTFTKAKDTLTGDINSLHIFTQRYMKLKEGLIERFCEEVCLAVILEAIVLKLITLRHNPM